MQMSEDFFKSVQFLSNQLSIYSDCIDFILPTRILSSTYWITSIIGHRHQVLRAQYISRLFTLIHIIKVEYHEQDEKGESHV